jgi:NAD(P)-dependent dehydrogenase (short-subunit alcohol dehydrogenase family)
MKKVALVTGAGSGIGRCTSLALASAGFHLVLAGRRLSALEDTAELIGDDNATCISCDISTPQSVDAMYEKIESKFGRLDVLFNNAGNNVPAATFGDIPVEDWLMVINVNLTGAFLAAQGAFKLMRKQQPQGGRIINNGSISAHTPRPGSAPYTASKHAITGLTRTISLDGRPYDIACGQIDIGNAASEMTEKMNTGVPQADLSIKPEPTMDVSHVGDAVTSMAVLPLSANVQFMTIMATAMPYVGRG